MSKVQVFLGILAVSLTIMAVGTAALRWRGGDESELLISIGNYSVHLYGLQAELAAFPFVLLCVWAAYRIAFH
jgi:hypothetical protein